MRERRLNEVKGVILVALGLMVLASLIRFERLDLPFYTSHPNFPPKNLLGIFGAYLGEIIIFLFGRPTSFVLPLLIILLGVKFFRQEKPYLSLPRILGMLVLLVSVSSLIGMFNLNNESFRFYYSGLFGSLLPKFITAYFSRLGGFIIFITFILLSLALVTDILLASLFANLLGKAKIFFTGVFKREKKGKSATFVKVKPGLIPEPKPALSKPRIIDAAESLVSRPKIQIKAKPAPSPELKIKPQELKIGDYHLPALDLLDSPPPLEARQIKGDLEASARILEETLEDFGISVKVTDIERGPVITRYELEPAPGVKVSRIESLGDDIALSMKAQSVRIIAPIPGKDRVGIEVPNTQSSLVYLQEMLASEPFQKTKSSLALALGKDIAGKTIVARLENMPHLLIAGTTGSGKTVCINALILSLLYRNSPADLKFVMIDPKMVELMPFNGLPHLLCPLVTEAKKAAAALNWVVNEMEERYRLLAKAGNRNIESYNEKEKKLPYIVVVVDEFADLMVVMPDQIETAVQRLAQLARAVGIHLILATQRPSVNVITGVIKANLPARLSFKVASKVDSRTVLDMNGADKLLGKGDMLFLNPGDEKPTRIQGALVSDKEIEKVVTFIKGQSEPVYNEDIVKEQQKTGLANGEKDELYDEAVKIIMESNQASVSILQRRMRLGYTRAARIIDMMEQEGLVGPYEGSKPRRILVDREAWLKDAVVEGFEDKQT
ncbi:MAG: DNA translocase FtsK 4TM domain-containing protein [Candidatus Omnitrophota bacterium]|nr:DNA translocase FtsK 4TM domain-containing protein [Candidatus Omnitrophota bacterium]MDD5518034.1 DNA translocase FtsK 4TM domain-containing protein [Candidatus Omnitrophota bacterium]